MRDLIDGTDLCKKTPQHGVLKANSYKNVDLVEKRLHHLASGV